MRGRARDDHDEDVEEPEEVPRRQPRRPLRPRKVSRGMPLWLILLLVLLPVLAGAGVLIYFLVFQPQEEKQQARERFLGEWQAPAPKPDWPILRLKVTEGELVLTGIDPRSGKSGAEKMNWKITKIKKGVLTVHLRRPQADKDADWTVEFDGEDRMRVANVGSSSPTWVYTRLGRRP
jgi:hypothetical protein